MVPTRGAFKRCLSAAAAAGRPSRFLLIARLSQPQSGNVYVFDNQ